MGPDAEVYDRLRRQLRDHLRSGPDEDDSRQARRARWRRLRDDPEYQALRYELRAIERRYPVSWEESARRVEAVLPAGQAGMGRARLEARLQRRGMRFNRPDPVEQRPEPPADGTAGVGAPDGGAGAPPEAAEGVGPVQPRPPDAWETYVRNFARDYEFTPAQVASAMGILRGLRLQANQIEQVNLERRAALSRIADPAERNRQLRELNQPIDLLFETLRRRLEGLLTSRQRHLSPPPRGDGAGGNPRPPPS
jgi:hypothetical protein